MPLELVAPTHRATLVADVGSSLVRCAPEEAVDPVVFVWLAAAVYGPGAVSRDALGYSGPPSSIERRAREAVVATRPHWCR